MKTCFLFDDDVSIYAETREEAIALYRDGKWKKADPILQSDEPTPSEMADQEMTDVVPAEQWLDAVEKELRARPELWPQLQARMKQPEGRPRGTPEWIRESVKSAYKALRDKGLSREKAKATLADSLGVGQLSRGKADQLLRELDRLIDK